MIGMIGLYILVPLEILYNFGFFSVEDLGGPPDTDLAPYSDRPGFAKFARVKEMLVVPDENCGVALRMSGASGRPVNPIFRDGSINYRVESSIN